MPNDANKDLKTLEQLERELNKILSQIQKLMNKRVEEFGEGVKPIVWDSTALARQMIMNVLTSSVFRVESLQAANEAAESAMKAAKTAKSRITPAKISKISKAQKRLQSLALNGARSGAAAHDMYSDMMDQIRPSDRDAVREGYDSKDLLDAASDLATTRMVLGKTGLWSEKEIAKLLSKKYGKQTPKEAFKEGTLQEEEAEEANNQFKNEGLS